jgi:hypothetical protein
MSGDPIRLLETISPSFCPLRWSYLQIDLQHGRAKACCKTPFEQMTARQLDEQGSAALFNSGYVQQRRREMLAGVRHDDCAACWQAEALGLESYRRAQSAKPMFRGVTEKLLAHPAVDGAVPRHIEIILKTTCDLACSYCGPDFSTRWQTEIERQGPYPHDDSVPAPTIQVAPPQFDRMFRRWLAENLSEVAYIQFNGGEPLIQDDFYDFIELVLSTPTKQSLQLGVITNLNTPPARLRQLLKVLPELHRRHAFRFGISLDAVGSRAEYIRFGLRWDRFDQNLRSLLDRVPDLDVQLAPTFSALSVTDTLGLIRYAQELEAHYRRPLIFRPSMVMSPDFQSPLILLAEDYRHVDEAVDVLDSLGKWPELRDRLHELRDAAERFQDADRSRAAFYRWFTEYDRRRGLKFTSVFPELADFWRRCEELARDC